MTQREYTLDDGQKSYILTADAGKDIVRISDNFNFGSEIWLGYRYTNKDRVLEVPTDFKEVEQEEKIQNS